MDCNLVASFKIHLSPSAATPIAPSTSTTSRYPTPSLSTTPLRMLNMTYFGSNPRDTNAGASVDLGWKPTTNTEWRSVTPMLIQNNKEFGLLRSWPEATPGTDRVTVILPDAGTTKRKVHFELWCTTAANLDPFLCGRSSSFQLLPPLFDPSLSATAPTPSATLETTTSIPYTPDTPYTPSALPTSQILRTPSFSMGAIIGIAIISLITLAILCSCTTQRRVPPQCLNRKRRTIQKTSITHPQIVAPWNTSFVHSSGLDNDVRRVVASTSMRIPQSTLNISYPIVTGIGDAGGEGPRRTLAPPSRRIDLETQTPLPTHISRQRVATLHHLPSPLPVVIPPRSNSRRTLSTRCYTCHPDQLGQEGDTPVQQQYPWDTRGSDGQMPIATGSGVEDLNRHLEEYLQELHRVSVDSSTLGLTRGNLDQRHDRLHAISRHPGDSAGCGGSVGSSRRAPPPPPAGLYI